MPEPIATWNSARGVWERPETNILCGHSALFSGTWPTSGMTRGGRLYPLPTRGHRTAASGSSSSPGLLPTPAAGNFNDGESPESWEARRQANLAKGINGNGQGTPLAMAVRMLQTPNATDGQGGPRALPERRTSRGRDHGPRLRDAAPALLKTPTAQLAVNGGSQHPDKRKAGGHGPTLADQVEHQLLPTPTARLGDDTSRGADPARYKGPQSLHGRRSNLDDCIAAIETRAPWLLPTPTAMDSHGARNATAKRSAVKESTNDAGWTLSDVFWTGELTNPPSAAGNSSPGGPHPGQLSLDGPGNA